MNIALSRPYIFAKIHGIYSRFSSPDEMAQALGSGSTDTILDKLALKEPLAATSSNSEKEIEQLLHAQICRIMLHLLPNDPKIRRIFLCLLQEYEVRNISIYLKNRETKAAQSYFPFPDEVGFFSRKNLLALSKGKNSKTIDALLQNSQYQKAFEEFQETKDGVALDTLLEKEHQTRLHKAVSTLPATERSVILPLLNNYMVITNTLAALRLVKIYNRPPATISNAVFTTDETMQQELHTLLTTEQYETIFSVFPKAQRNKLAYLIKNQQKLQPESFDQELGLPELTAIEKISETYTYHLFKNGFYKNPKTYGPLFCFYFLLKREILNIMLLFNCKRFNIDRSTFKKELVY